ncbi:PKD domain-containing protein, partial [Winogradskyella sp. 3972H.M.0a.05]|uniref:PKD domain-containing protein n=1 Tax=Winogradskyella sp. 3972H.M.0a.05 TaxID=2950277 RepID=UPI003398BA43
MKRFILSAVLIALSLVAFSQDINMQNGTFNQCTDVFYDSGGQNGNYSSDENLSLTICPINVGDQIQLDFTEFSTQLNQDVMTIYDGPDNTAPSLGSFSGVAGPGTVQANNPSGCLTIEFVSNGSGTTTGWAANIACATPCQTITANFDSSVPAADASNTINADVNEQITFNGSGTFSVDGTGATYEWDFGNGDTAFGQSVDYIYTIAGIYTVNLTITDTNPQGCSSTNTINVTVIVGASTPGNPFVDAGDDVTVDCAGGCVDLSAEFLDIGETNTYTVTQIPFVPPFEFNGLTNSLNPNIDDAWSSVENLPFDFCFFTNIETQFQVGSNGVIRFDVNAGDTGNGWAFSENLPNNTNDTLGEANVFTPCHDIDPSVGTTEEIAWEIIGTAPNRVLAVSFFNVPYFSCNNLVATHMAVFYETTNVIDIYIKDKPTCNTWNSGNAVVGIQNDAGTTAFVPPGRNTSDSPWTTTDEAWRFTPAGPSIVDFAWLDAADNVLSTDPNFQVCPTDPSTTYTARVVYTNCNGDTVEVTDDVTITTTSAFSVDIGPDMDLCEGDADIVLDADIGSATATYQWYLDAIPLGGETNPTLTVSSPNSGTYLVEVTDVGCLETDEAVITFHPNPVVNVVTDYQLCDDAVIDGFTEFDLSTKDAEAIGVQTDVNVTYHTSQTDADAGANAVGPLFTNTVNPQTIYIRIENSNNTNCYVTSTFDLIVGSGITPVQPDDMVQCDDPSGDNTETFDLSTQTAIILGGSTGFTVTYHETQTDADSGINPLPTLYDNTSNPQTIYVRIENDMNANCFETISFQLILNPAPDAILPTPLEECDDTTADGFTSFNLSEKTNEIINGQADVVISYHETALDAQNNINPLADGYINIVPFNQVIFVRIENTVTGCINFTILTLQVNPNPVATVPTPLEACDDDSDGFVEFDLSLRDLEVIGA